MTWEEQAACTGKPTVWWFPEIGKPGAPMQDYRVHVAQAVAVCSACPVQEDCLRHALERNEKYGVWGGLTPAQRADVRAGRRREPTRPGPERPPIKHGTRGGEKAHRRRGEEPCQECVDARRAYDRARYLANPEPYRERARAQKRASA